MYNSDPGNCTATGISCEEEKSRMNKMREYERGREDGLDLALRIVRQGGDGSS